MKQDTVPLIWTLTKRKKYGVVIYNFKDYSKSSHYLNLEIGEVVHIIEECAGWFRGYSLKDRSNRGIFPANVISLKPFKIDNEGLSETIVPDEDSISREVVQVVREWYSIWLKLYLDHQTDLLDRMTSSIEDLIEMRRHLISETLTNDQVKDVKLKIVSKIDAGNSRLGLDVVPRIDGERADPDYLSPVKLYQIHCDSSIAANGSSHYRRTSAASYTGSGQSAISPSLTTTIHFLHLQIRELVLNLFPLNSATEENLELSFTLFDSTSSNNMQYLSEKFIIRTPTTGPTGRKSASSCFPSAIFSDIGNADLGRDLYIVVHLYRLGRMQIPDGKGNKVPTSTSLLSSSFSSNSNAHSTSTLNGSSICKRPLGVGVVPLNEIIRAEGSEKEMSLKFFSNNDAEYYQVHEMLIRKLSTAKLTQLNGASVQLNLRFITSSLSRFKRDCPLIFKSAVLVQKRGFPDVIMPGDVRNDLYVTLDGGEFEKGGKSIAKNIEATVQLVAANDGKIIPACISNGSGTELQSSVKSIVLYHNNSPKWHEMLKILIPLELFDGAHIRIEYRHCSSKGRDKQLIGFSFVPLSDEIGAILTNGTHELYVYKCDDHKKLLDVNSYIFLPWGPKDRLVTSHQLPTNCPYSRSAKETIHVTTLLCSTKLTQNSDLLGLLKWRDNPEHVQESLYKMMRLSGEEIVKFLQDILDSLFSMFATHEGSATSQTQTVFDVLVHIFLLLEDVKFAHFKPVLDTYIKEHFSAALVYKELMVCLVRNADIFQNKEKRPDMIRCFRCLEYFFKLIIQSRLLYSRATGDSNDEEFKKELFGLFANFTYMLGTINQFICANNGIVEDSDLISIQVAFIDTFPSTYEQVIKVLSKVELARMVKTTINGLPSLDHSPQLIRSKLNCILSTVKSEIFRDRDSRLELLEPLVRHINYHMARGQEMKMCCEIVSDILIFLHQETKSGNGTNYSEVQIISKCTLDTFVKCILDSVNNCSNLMEEQTQSLSANLIALLRMMEDTHYSQFLARKDRDAKKEFLIRIFFVFKSIQNVFPREWMVMRLMTNNVILCSLQELATPLTDAQFLSEQFDKSLWTSYFSLAVAFLTQKDLQLEELSEIKREYILDRYADMRVLMGFQILSMWEHLNGKKVNFIPDMVAPFLQITLIPENELRKATLPIFYDMMDAEYKSYGNFKQVESNLIDKLDVLVNDKKGDDDFRRLFNTINNLKGNILSKIHQNNPVWREEGVYFTNSITKLLELLLDYRLVMEGDENREKRMSCTYNLLNFYLNEINRKEMYIRYIYKLCDLHLVSPENWTEAGFTLKLRADLLQWGYNRMSKENAFDDEMEWQRKEKLYLQIIEYFDRGKAWEEAIKLCKELAYFYERKLFDYAKLSSILKMEARFLDAILTQLRPEPEYFRVGFYGQDFPQFLRNKVFVYRGQEYERIAAFTQRLQSEFPKATIMSKNSPPEPEILNSNSQSIQICNVKPVPESRVEFEGHNIPEKVLSYYQVNDVRNFTYDRPVKKGSVDQENEFKSLWIERTTLTLATPLPGILRWFQIYSMNSIEISPLEYACETVENMNKELQKLITQYTFEPHIPISPLSMRLQGVIEAAVNGGVAKYQEAFFTSRFLQSNPDQTDKIQRLRQLILQKVKLLEGGLSLHGRLAPSNVQPLHKRLVERFQLMRQSVYEANSSHFMFDFDSRNRPSILSQPLPPIPPVEIKEFSTDVLHEVDMHLKYRRNTEHDEQIYAVPHESNGCSLSRPKSAGFDADGLLIETHQQMMTTTVVQPVHTNGAHPNKSNPSSAVQRSRSIPRNHHLQQPGGESRNGGNVISATSIDVDSPDAPPLPPRSGTLERPPKVDRSEDVVDHPAPNHPPALPRRTNKKHPPPPPPCINKDVICSPVDNKAEATLSPNPPPLPTKRNVILPSAPPNVPLPPAPTL